MLPPLNGVAVNVMGRPGQPGLLPVVRAILTRGASVAKRCTTIEPDMAVAVPPHWLVNVSLALTVAPSAMVDVV